MYLLGIDVGTSATKALVMGVDGGVAGVASADHPLLQPRAGWTEQRPSDWWNSTRRAVRMAIEASGASAASIAGVALSGQMHGSVLLDEAMASGRFDESDEVGALRPALLWNDQRTAAQCAEIESLAGGRAALVEMVGNAALTGFTLPKLLWVREHEPEVYARVAAVMLPKDYVRFRMTGEIATDVGDASGTLLWDVDTRDWHAGMVERVGIEPAWLPRAAESSAPAGAVTDAAAEALGLRAGTPVMAGSGDNQCGAIGAGIVETGQVIATLGTSGVVYAHADAPRKDIGVSEGVAGRLHTMCSATGSAEHVGGWCVTGCMLSAAGSLQWAREALFPQASYDELMAEAAAVSPGCEGLVFLPYLTGERCPYPDPLARGGWIGLTSRHTRGHLVRAVVEGVTFGMGQMLDLMRGIGIEPSRARIGGGGARSVLWRQMVADVLGVPVALPNTAEGPAYGAAIMAGVGVGQWGSVGEACGAVIRDTETLEPDAVAAGRYAQPRAVYGKLYGDLRERFAELRSV